jgi:hypothetical protein
MSEGVSRFKIHDSNTWYVAEKITASMAISVGCPWATHRITGPRTRTIHYGSFTPSGRVKGAHVTVPGTKLKGIRVKFNGELDGYLLDD